MYERRNNFDRQTELENCTFVKTVLMIIIVLFHSILAWNNSWFSVIGLKQSAPALELISSWMSTFHVYAFACVSGYLFYYCKYERKSSTYQDLLKFTRNKVKRLIIPYYVVAVVWVAPAKQFFYPCKNIGDFCKAYLFGEDAEQLWFLLMLFLVFVIAFMLSDYVKRHTLYGVLICIIFFFVGLVVTRGMPNYFCWRTAFQYLIFFFLGFWIRQYNNLNRIPWFVWLLLNISFFTLNRYIVTSSALMLGVSSIIQLISHIAGAIFAFAFLQRIAFSFRYYIRESRLWKVLAENSMGIYMFHMQVIYYTLFLFNGALHPVVHSVVNFVSAFFISLMLSILLRHFRVTRFLIGG